MPSTAVPFDQEYVPPPVAFRIIFGVLHVKILVVGGVIPAMGNGLMTTVKVVVVAQIPADGVKVYVVVCWLFNAGDQVPVIPFNDVFGNGVIVFPAQTAAIGLNVGVMFGLMIKVPLTLPTPFQKPPPLAL